MESKKKNNFGSLTESIGKFDLRNKIVLIPAMNRVAAHLIAATFKGFGILAEVLETYKGLDLGKKYTSGKECFPCQITMGDILYFLNKEEDKLGDFFNPENYLYFLPESDGPCRFGMYNKYQRMVLDTFPGLEKLRIVSLTTRDGYSLEGLIEEERLLDFRKAIYLAVVVADVLDRLLWRIRPYEKQEGSTDEYIERSMGQMQTIFETYGVRKEFDKILDKLEEIIKEGTTLIDPAIPAKPLIGIVGEIFLRMHVAANQDLIRILERHGAEVVNASLAEWVNYISYDRLKNAKYGFRLNLNQLNFASSKSHLKSIIKFKADLLYQEYKQKQVYKRVKRIVDLIEDHKIVHLERILEKDDIYSFQVGTEACLSIATVVDCARTGYNGMVNVFPFTCMPSMTTSAIVKPLMKKMRMPYLDVSYDSSIQPGREATIRTFMHQSYQHFQRYGNIRANSNCKISARKNLSVLTE
jgi:predicted nucleotide-binding protein (sugar kinase/HSP70/actin superfamily)